MTNSKLMDRPTAFISSTVIDLPDHRAAAVNACRRVGFEPLMMEAWPPTDADPSSVCRDMLDRADVYIGILGFRYGYVPAGQDKSLTEIEYQRSLERGIPRLVFLMSSEHPIRVQDVEIGTGAEKLKAFKSMVLRDSIVTEFRSAGELQAAVVTALVEVLRSPLREPKPPSALLLLPFAEKHNKLRAFLSAALKRDGIREIRLDEIKTGDFWANALSDAMREADFVIADVTGANPNVMYEIGYVHALRKTTILLSESDAFSSIPFHLRAYRILAYDPEEIDALSGPLARFLHEYTRGGRL